MKKMFSFMLLSILALGTTPQTLYSASEDDIKDVLGEILVEAKTGSTIDEFYKQIEANKYPNYLRFLASYKPGYGLSKVPKPVIDFLNKGEPFWLAAEDLASTNKYKNENFGSNHKALSEFHKAAQANMDKQQKPVEKQKKTVHFKDDSDSSSSSSDFESSSSDSDVSSTPPSPDDTRGKNKEFEFSLDDNFNNDDFLSNDEQQELTLSISSDEDENDPINVSSSSDSDDSSSSSGEDSSILSSSSSDSDDSSSDDDTKEELPKRKAKAGKTASTWVPSKKPAKGAKALDGNQLNALLRQARRKYKLEKNAGIAAAKLAQVRSQATAGNATAKNILKYLSLPKAKK